MLFSRTQKKNKKYGTFSDTGDTETSINEISHTQQKNPLLDKEKLKVLENLNLIIRSNIKTVKSAIQQGVIDYEALKNIADVAISLYILGFPQKAITIKNVFSNLTKKSIDNARAHERAEALYTIEKYMEIFKKNALELRKIDGSALILLLKLSQTQGEFDRVWNNIQNIMSDLEENIKFERLGYCPVNFNLRKDNYFINIANLVKNQYLINPHYNQEKNNRYPKP